jgi:hypothetical protein
MEVLVALSIFLFSMVVLGHLITLGGTQAYEVQQRNEATRRCQSKMNEVVIGAVPLSGQSESSDDDSGWFWAMDCEQGTAPNLWTVQVRAYRKRADGSKIEATLTQMVLDPSVRGSTMDTVAVTGSDTGSGTSGGSSGTGGSSPSGATSPQQGSSMPSGMSGGSGMPKSGSSPAAGAAPRSTGPATGTAPRPSSGPPATGTPPSRGTTPSPAPKGKG